MGLFGDKPKRRFMKVVDIVIGELEPALIKAKDEFGEEKFEKILMNDLVLGWMTGFVRAIAKAKKAEGIVSATVAVCGEVLGNEVGSQVATRMEEIFAGGQGRVDLFEKISKAGERVGEMYLSKHLGYTGYELKGVMQMVVSARKL